MMKYLALLSVLAIGCGGLTPSPVYRGFLNGQSATYSAGVLRLNGASVPVRHVATMGRSVEVSTNIGVFFGQS